MAPKPEDFLPSPEEAIRLPLDVLGMRLLSYLAAAQDSNEPHYVDRDLVTLGGFWRSSQRHEPSFIRAMTETWDWLVANGLLSGPARQHRADAFVTREGRRLLQDTDPLARLRAGRRLNVDLHPAIAERVRTQYPTVNTSSRRSPRCVRWRSESGRLLRNPTPSSA